MGGGGVICILWFRRDVISLNCHQRASYANMVGQEVEIYGVFIQINNKPCRSLHLSLNTINTLGHFNILSSPFLHETVPLSICRIEGILKQYSCHFHSRILVDNSSKL